jgi:hypothetical protein
VMTAPYRVNDRTNEIYKDEVLISKLNPKNLKGIERKIFNHQLIYLNPNYKGEDTPQNYRDWLDLIYESIHNPENPKLNTDNLGIKRAIEIVNFENISPEEWEEAKIEVGKRKVIKLSIEEREIEIAQNMISDRESDDKIMKYTGLSLEKIKNLRQSMN